ncbi:hypothetical protein LCGC14_0353640 [marine sediment metagenome]|uniref:Uncharacterized protein n=1 Tax=marine sediment metagenome TaxID=412755 RepID=A0A0F9TT49_9ZZZZ
MAETSRPWSGIVLGDSGPYSDDQWTDIWLGLIAPTIATEGVFIDQLDNLSLSGLPASPVTIESGRALVDGSWYESSASVAVAIPTPAGNPRVDRIVLRKDWALQTIRITRIAGAEAAAPTPPAITQNDGVTWDLPLWQVHITVGAVITVFADDREFIGQYHPLGISATKVYIENDFFTPQLTLPDGSFLNEFRVTASSGNVAVRGESGLAGFGSGALGFVHTGGGAGGDSALIESVQYKPDLINARLVIRAKNPNTDGNLDRVMGFVGNGGTLTPAEGVYFRADGAGNWFAIARTGGVEAGSAIDTGQALDDVWRKFEIRQTATDVVQYLIDDVVVATNRVNIPSDLDLDLVINIFDNGAVPANLVYLQADYLTLRGDRP